MANQISHLRSDVQRYRRGSELTPRSERFEAIVDKAYNLLEAALEEAYRRLEQGEIKLNAKDLIALLQLFKNEQRR